VRTTVLVVGGGIAGASLGYELSDDHEVILVEAEATAGAHSTGRAAALFVRGIGPEPIRQLSRDSFPLFDELEDELGTAALRRTRGGLHIACSDEQLTAVDAFALLDPGLQVVSAEQALSLVPVLRPDLLRGACWDDEVADLDVMALHAGYLAGLRRRGGQVLVGTGLVALQRSVGSWRAELATGRVLDADLVVNAAGAWGDDVNRIAGVHTHWLTPCRRTAVLSAPPRGGWTGPVIGAIDGSWYAKAEGDAVLLSPCDETPVQAGDVRPDELDVAVALERVNAVTTLGLRSVRSAWAGLRTFAPDHVPVVGQVQDLPLFAFVGQGGYGIQAGPALARLAAQVLRGSALTSEDQLLAKAMSPQRLDEGAGW
jgi:D-arginine dehydrogenase